MLKVEDLRAWYGHTQALFGVELEVALGETMAIVGVNGAGKSTTLGAIAGIVNGTGYLEFDGQRLDEAPAYQRARAGMGLVPEGRRLFWQLTVHENLSVGLGPKGTSIDPNILELFPEIANRMHTRVSNLSGGEQQMVAIARAMMRRPRLLMLDEPSLGLAPLVVDKIYDRLGSLREASDLTILLVEQSIALARDFADRLCLLRNGRVATVVESSDTTGVDGLAEAALGDSRGGPNQGMPVS